MPKSKKLILILFIAISIIAGLAFGKKANAQTYYATGTLVSKDLIFPNAVNSIDYFGYYASSIPAGTSLKVQFSQDKVNWYSSTGTLDGFDILSEGDHLSTSTAIDLSSLGWTADHFYYRIFFETTDTSKTPVLDEIRLYYTPATPAPNDNPYYATGTLVSKDLIFPNAVNSIDYFGYYASSIPAGTSLKVQFSQDKVNWYSSTGTLDGFDILSEGDHLSTSTAIDLSSLGWTADHFYYRIFFETTDTSKTPVLDEIRLYYTPATPAPNDNPYYATGTLVSKDLIFPNAVNSIDYFGYYASSIPAGTSLKVQFSQDKVNWYSSTGTLDGFDILSEGDHLSTSTAIDLSSLGWTADHFYYRIFFETTDTSKTPVLDEIRVYYTSTTPPVNEGPYYLSGTLVSKNLLDGKTVINIDTFFSSSTLPTGTSLWIQFSTNTTDWYSADGVKDSWTYLPNGQFKTIISYLGWATPKFHYRIRFETDAPDKSPILDEIQIDYNIYHSPQLKGSIRIKGGTIIK
jgi:hypothetical protein